MLGLQLMFVFFFYLYFQNLYNKLALHFKQKKIKLNGGLETSSTDVTWELRIAESQVPLQTY